MEGGGANIFYIEGGDKRFYIKEWTNIYVGGSGGYDDVYRIMDVSEANILVSIIIFHILVSIIIFHILVSIIIFHILWLHRETSFWCTDIK